MQLQNNLQHIPQSHNRTTMPARDATDYNFMGVMSSSTHTAEEKDNYLNQSSHTVSSLKSSATERDQLLDYNRSALEELSKNLSKALNETK